MNELSTNLQFTMEDIRKIRNANSERHIEMSSQEIIAETKQKSDLVLRKIEKLKMKKSSTIQ